MTLIGQKLQLYWWIYFRLPIISFPFFYELFIFSNLRCLEYVRIWTIHHHGVEFYGCLDTILAGYYIIYQVYRATWVGVQICTDLWLEAIKRQYVFDNNEMGCNEYNLNKKYIKHGRGCKHYLPLCCNIGIARMFRVESKHCFVVNLPTQNSSGGCHLLPPPPWLCHWPAI